MIQTVSFIGSGRVATHLAQVLAQHIAVKQIYSRALHNAQKLAELVDAQAIDEVSLLEKVDLLVICVSDAEIQNVVEHLAEQQYSGLMVHTSGSTSIEVISKYAIDAGVFYPLQTFSFEHTVDWKNTPLLIEANKEEQQALLLQLAEKISDRCYAYNSEQRLSLHLAAVFACNFSNHCYDIAQQIVEQRQVDFNLLMPLINATTQKLAHTSAYQNQTGPARRNDDNILNLHQQMLNNQNTWQQIYQLMSQSIQKRFET